MTEHLITGQKFVSFLNGSGIWISGFWMFTVVCFSFPKISDISRHLATVSLHLWRWTGSNRSTKRKFASDPHPDSKSTGNHVTDACEIAFRNDFRIRSVAFIVSTQNLNCRSKSKLRPENSGSNVSECWKCRWSADRKMWTVFIA
jgi:hypothetical protein